MKRLLLYGDSNSWGYVPGSGSRFEEQLRWPGVLATELGAEARVIEEGLNGRTTVFDDPFEPGKNGKRYLKPCLESHRPLDLVVIMLGTNDLKHRFGLSAFDIAEGIRCLAELVLTGKVGPDEGRPDLLLVAPPHLNPEGLGEAFKGGVEKSHDLARCYLKVAKELGCAFLDAASHVSSSPIDGVHLDEQAHQALGMAVAEQVRLIFDDPILSTPEVAAHNPSPDPSGTAAAGFTVSTAHSAASAAIALQANKPFETQSDLSPEEQEKVQAMRASVGKLTVALGERGKGQQAREVLEANGFDPDTVDLELGRRVYTALRDLLKT